MLLRNDFNGNGDLRNVISEIKIKLGEKRHEKSTKSTNY